MDGKKPYVIAIIIQVIYTGLYVVSKAAFDEGMNTFVFIFYRQAAATLLLLPLAIILERRNAPAMSLRLFTKLFMYALLGNTITMNMYNVSLKYTSATVASATSNSVPVVTFFLALLLRLEVIRLRTLSGVAKAAGVALCLAGVLVIALYAGPAISPMNHHRAFNGGVHGAESSVGGTSSRARWMKGTFLMLLSNTTWSLWIVLQASLLKEYPNKLLATLIQCALSTLQSLLLAAAVVRADRAAWRLRLDAGLLAVAYTGFVVTGVSFYLQSWCIEKKGPVFLAMSNPLCFVFTIFCSSFFLGEIVHLGSIVGGVLLVAGLYSVLWGKSKEHTINMQLTLAATAAASTQQVKQRQEEDDKMDIAGGGDEQEEIKQQQQQQGKMAASPEQQADHGVSKMEEKKPYVIAMLIQVIYAGMFVVTKAAFDEGMNTFVFIFYRQAAATLLLLPLALLLERKNARSMSLMLLIKLFFCAFIGNTFSLNLYNVSMKFTSATVASAASNSLPVITFFLALITRMECVKVRSSSGVAKLAGVALCFAGVMVLALYKGPALNPLVNHHHIASFAGDARSSSSSRGAWIRGIFLMVLANVTWSIWIVLQAAVLREFPNKMLVTAAQCVFSTVQTAVVAVAAEREMARWKLRLDISLLAVLYTGLVVTGVSYYLQAWCVELKGPVFLAMSNPLCLLLTIFCSSFFLAEIVHLGSIIGGILLVGGLYSVLWGKSAEMTMNGNGDEQQQQQSHHKISTEMVVVEKTMISGSQEQDQNNNEQSTPTKSPLQQV
uniref:EamA domain-containing protein n=1 Tax=Oryza meridionalis TaxID=40149 RepID=A0A0E0DKW4_9ORYZ